MGTVREEMMSVTEPDHVHPGWGVAQVRWRAGRGGWWQAPQGLVCHAKGLGLSQQQALSGGVEATVDLAALWKADEEGETGALRPRRLCSNSANSHEEGEERWRYLGLI